MEYEKVDGFYSSKRVDVLSLFDLRDGIKVLVVFCGLGDSDVCCADVPRRARSPVRLAPQSS